MIYFDYSANFPIDSKVLECFNSVEREYFGNAVSSHVAGYKTLDRCKKATDELLDTLKLDKNEYEVIFTSSASESNNLAIKGIFNSYSGFGNHILCSPFEHSSITATLGYLKETYGAEIEQIPLDKEGRISVEKLKYKLRIDTILVCLILAESETGRIQPYKEVIDLLKYCPRVHLLIDATQVMGKVDLDYNGIDLLTFTPHKFGGIVGTGFLIKKKKTVLTPLIHGGVSLSMYRSSTFPTGLYVSSIEAVKIAYSSMNEHYQYVLNLYNYLIDNLKQFQNIDINSFYDFPYILNISIKDTKASDVVKYLSDNDICVSQKSACSIKNTPSKTIMAMYSNRARALSSFRISLSYLTKKEEIDQLIKVLRGITK